MEELVWKFLAELRNEIVAFPGDSDDYRRCHRLIGEWIKKESELSPLQDYHSEISAIAGQSRWMIESMNRIRKLVNQFSNELNDL